MHTHNGCSHAYPRSAVLARWDGVSVVAKSPAKACGHGRAAIPLVRKLVGARRRYGIPRRTVTGRCGPGTRHLPWRCRRSTTGWRACARCCWPNGTGCVFAARPMLRAEAVRLRRLADELDAEADYLESRQSSHGACQCDTCAWRRCLARG